ncbi:hypothetical protein GCM10011610_24840 [Nocardia rhizosphaerihabitans]|uniref:Uncharacterized protein n=1 Tax=Nocardia rhizosphaerihabitans TaxID=1691570 RepID=A0ABQ2KFG3_9NOCA|nr:hypothetical protein GCM10011610_24840 [Nocardia rhizosphaerihabitans]
MFTPCNNTVRPNPSTSAAPCARTGVNAAPGSALTGETPALAIIPTTSAETADHRTTCPHGDRPGPRSRRVPSIAIEIPRSTGGHAFI